LKQVKTDFSSRFEKYFPSLRTYFDFSEINNNGDKSTGLIRNSRLLGVFLILLLLTLLTFLYFFANYQQQNLKIKKALQNPFLEGKLTNPLIKIDSLESLRYCLHFVCSGKFTQILKELSLEPIDHFHIWQFRVKGRLMRKGLLQ
jgi:hypothetical protein